jgi:peptidylprolyl isomerase
LQEKLPYSPHAIPTPEASRDFAGDFIEAGNGQKEREVRGTAVHVTGFPAGNTRFALFIDRRLHVYHNIEGIKWERSDGISREPSRTLPGRYIMTAKNGDRAKLHYTGRLEDGKVFDTTRGRQPLEITLGEGNVIPGFEKEIIDMEIGDSKTFIVDPVEAFGPRRDELVVHVQTKDFPEHITPHVGQALKIRQPEGGVLDVFVQDIEEEVVTLDANHPLAGKKLVFDVELVEVG